MLIGCRLHVRITVKFVFEVLPRPLCLGNMQGLQSRCAGFTARVEFSEYYFAETPNDTDSYTIGI